MQDNTVNGDETRTMTLEAFADTIIPGARRGETDRAIAGVSAGGGAVAAGAVELISHPALGFADVLDPLVTTLNEHAQRYATRNGRSLDPGVPGFVALSFADRTNLVAELVAVGHPERELWIGLALFSNMAFDSAAHMTTAKAVAEGHVGLATMGFAAPDSDGLWRFPEFSYGRALAKLHPETTSTGSPA